MTPLRLPKAFLPTFKEICNLVGHEIKSDRGVPILGNKLYDGFSKALNHKNYSALKLDSNAYGNGPFEVFEFQQQLLDNLHKELQTPLMATRIALQKAITQKTPPNTSNPHQKRDSHISIPTGVMSAINTKSGISIIVGGTGSGRTTLLNELCMNAEETTFVVGSIPVEWQNYMRFTESQYDIKAIMRCNPALIVFDDARNVQQELADAIEASKIGYPVLFATHSYGLADTVRWIIALNEFSLDCVTTYVTLAIERRGSHTERTYQVLEVTESNRDEFKRASHEGKLEEVVNQYSVIYISTQEGEEKHNFLSYRQRAVSYYFDKSITEIAGRYADALHELSLSSNHSGNQDELALDIMCSRFADWMHPLTKNEFKTEFVRRLEDIKLAAKDMIKSVG